jgi:hypothetical protein
MEPVKVVEQQPKEYQMWEFDEIIFINNFDTEAVPFGILREDWDTAMEKHGDVVYKALEEFGCFDVYVLVTPEYWEHYKTCAHLVFCSDEPEYSPNIVEAWENRDTERIVRDTWVDSGFMLDLDGNVVPRLIHDTLYGNNYNLLECEHFIHKHPDLFGSHEFIDAPHWSNASHALNVSYQPTDELSKILKDWLNSIDKEDVWVNSPDEHYTHKYFEAYRREDS